MTVDEPKFVRVPRVSSSISVLPRCQRCGRTLRGAQVRWCSHKCLVWGSRMARALRDYLKSA